MFRNSNRSQPQSRLFYTYFLFSILFTGFVLIAACLTLRADGFLWADHLLYDFHFRWRGPEPVSGKVVLVLMDQASADELHRKKGTWSRRNMARALKNLCEAQADVIGLDVVFFAPDLDEGADLELASAMDQCGNVVLARFVAVEGRSEVSALPLFQEAMIGDGFVNMFPDRDGVLRKLPFLSIKPVDQGLAVFPSFSLEMVRAFRNLDFALDFSPEDHFVLGRAEGDRLRLPYPDLRINYAGRDRVFPWISYADVVRNRFFAEQVRGKMVLVGSALATDKDFFTTPFSGYRDSEEQFEETFGEVLTGDVGRKTPGVACHAHAIETILKGNFIRSADRSVVLVLIFVFGVLGLVFYPQRPGALWGLLILVTAGAATVAGAHVAFVKGLWVEVVPVLAILTVQYVAGIGLQRAYSRKKTQIVTGLFGKYVSRGVVEDILKGNIGMSLEGRSMEVTVLFSDLRSFTSISESLEPKETGQLLNTYFDAMIPTVFQHGGTLDKLIGDAVMAFFGAPAEMHDHPIQAAETALDMTHELLRLHREVGVKGVDRLAMGIGLNTGWVTAGNLGSQTFMDYTVIGDTVNLASRLEGLTKHYGVQVIVSGETAAHLDHRFGIRELDRVRVKGKDLPVTIHELMGFQEDLDSARMGLQKAFSRGLEHYRTRAWEEAEACFQEALDLVPGDGPSRLYLDRCRTCRENPPPEDWQGVTVFETK